MIFTLQLVEKPITEKLKKNPQMVIILFGNLYSADFIHFWNMVEINTDVLTSRPKILKVHIEVAIY